MLTKIAYRYSVGKGLKQNFPGLSDRNDILSLDLLTIIISFSILFIVAFGLSSRNMDSDGIMTWMMKKPKDWIGNKKH